MSEDLSKFPLIFLDIDGVLTNMNETPGSWLNHSSNEYGLSESNVTELQTLIELADAKVVISSNWRKFGISGEWNARGYTFSSPLKYVVELLGSAFAGALPPIRHMSKSEALKIWFEDLNIDPKKCKYVIFDDEPEEGFAESEFKEHYIETDPQVGLTKVDAVAALNMLT